jgi:exodeoxyribonuclease VII large subunit
MIEIVENNRASQEFSINLYKSKTYKSCFILLLWYAARHKRHPLSSSSVDSFAPLTLMNSSFSHKNNDLSSAVITVSALNHRVAQLLESTIPVTWVSGEISNFTRASSGHWYFTLKDSAAQVRAVMFKSRSQAVSFQPREGDKVEVRANVSLYTPRGDYQINVESMRRAGVGNLFETFLQLKVKLEQEGLFDSAHKRAIPRFIKRLGIVASPQSAALRDVMTTLARRAPHVSVTIYPTLVQGEGAAFQIAAAIASAEQRQECDVLLLCRGGGSIEDLWSFNEEVVARTMFHCTLPIISGVGHETDFTIADFVADLRAPTPTAAAELASPDRYDLVNMLRTQTRQLQKTMQRNLGQAQQSLDWHRRRLLSPLASVQNKRLNLQMSAQRLNLASKVPLRSAQAQLLQGRTRLMNQAPNIQFLLQQLSQHQQNLSRALESQVKHQQTRLTSLQAQIELLNPQRTLERGYAIVQDEQGQVIRSSAQIPNPGCLIIKTAKDSAQLYVQSVQKIDKSKA